MFTKYSPSRNAASYANESTYNVPTVLNFYVLDDNSFLGNFMLFSAATL